MGKPYIQTQRIRHTVGVGPHAVTATALKVLSSVAATAGAGATTLVHAMPATAVAAPVGMGAVTVTVA